jgi:hypothetical protein
MQSLLAPSPTEDMCVFYLLANGSRSSKFGGRVEEVMGRGRW